MCQTSGIGVVRVKGLILDSEKDWIAKKPGLCQFKLLTPQGLSSHLRKLGLASFSIDVIEEFWRIGLVRADLITADRLIRWPKLRFVRQIDHESYMYVDNRAIRNRSRGWDGAFNRGNKKPKFINLHFHPFRFVIFNHINRVFAANIAPGQMFYSANAFARLGALIADSQSEFSQKPEFVKTFARLNDMSELATALEPWAFSKVYGTVRPGGDYHLDLKEYRNDVKDHRKLISCILHRIGLDTIDDLRERICVSAELLDGNKVIHVLLRMMRGRERLNLESALGGSLLLRSMAEMMRIAAEDEFKIELKEEDELGFGQWLEGGRKFTFGTERLTGKPSPEMRSFVDRLGLDKATKVRCYVEGQTELGALSRGLSHVSRVEIIDLEGRVVERGRRGIGFRDSLKRDVSNGVFSIVAIDGDREDSVRVVRKATKDRDFFGRFLISDPDFERANFSLEELARVMWSWVNSYQLDVLDLPSFLECIRSAKDTNSLFVLARELFPNASFLKKGREWGEQLMIAAIADPRPRLESDETVSDRPIVELVRFASRCTTANYSQNSEKYFVDPSTGGWAKREIKQVK